MTASLLTSANMRFIPTEYDVWVLRHLTAFLGKHPTFDLLVQGAVLHNLLGGIWFAGAVFLLWLRPLSNPRIDVRRRLLTTLLGSAIAMALTFVCAALIKAVPPFNNPMFAGAYLGYMNLNENSNSFPSESTAVYSSVAAGVTSISAGLGSFLWVAVLFAVALPRMYVGGHYPSDVIAGLACGLVGYWTATRVERCIPSEQGSRPKCKSLHIVVRVLVFLWIVELANEFREVVWARAAVSLLAGPSTLSIGGDNAFRQFFHGRIDEVRIYDRAISGTEIAADMRSPIRSSVSQPGLVAAYSFDEGIGSVAHDASGHRHDGKVQNAAWTEGFFSRCLEFTGTESLLPITTTSDHGITRSVSVEAWVYPVAPIHGWADVVYKRVDRFYLEAGSNRGVPAFGTSLSGRLLTAYGNALLPLNTWTHLAGTFDGTSATLYVNGTPVAQTR